MNLPKITSKQQEITRLIYRYRFITRKQIQTLLGHTDKRRISAWLKELREQQFVDWLYDPNDPNERSTPAVYFLGVNGIRLLRETGEYAEESLRKRYKDTTRKQDFINRCLLIADCCIALRAKSNGRLQYSCVLPSEYEDTTYHFLHELKPHLFFTRQDGGEVTNYLLESFEITLPRYQLRKRLKDYVDFLACDWEEANGPRPAALFVCVTTADLLYVKRRIKNLVEENWPDENLRLSVTILDKIKKSGVSDLIWEEIH